MRNINKTNPVSRAGLIFSFADGISFKKHGIVIGKDCRYAKAEISKYINRPGVITGGFLLKIVEKNVFIVYNDYVYSL